MTFAALRGGFLFNYRINNYTYKHVLMSWISPFTTTFICTPSRRRKSLHCKDLQKISRGGKAISPYTVRVYENRIVYIRML